MDKYVIFGASSGAVKVAQTFKNLNIDFEYFVDNDSKKWSEVIENKPVKSPTELGQGDEKIIIASDYQSEIEEQLCKMGMLDRLILKEKLILENLLNRISQFDVKLDKNNNENSVIVELADAGICLGGIETWALMVSRDLMKSKKHVKLITREKEQLIPDDIKDNTIIINYDYDRYEESVFQTVETLLSMVPCTVVTNWQSQVMIAAILVKRMYPDQISILSVVHNDKIALYRRQAYLAPYTDYIFCVSKKIKRVFENEFNIPSEKLIYKESPVKYTEYKKNYELDNTKPLRIGFAARISKYQKRADLLLKVINELNERNVNFIIEIAGDGTYFNNLQEGIENNRNNVKLLGCITREEIGEFWKDKDVFLSVSDFEGTSISMLEAMSWGTVPVVTLVSGVDEFVENGLNGYCSEPGDWLSIVNNIIGLESHREYLMEFGTRCKNIIKTRCREEDYISELEKYL